LQLLCRTHELEISKVEMESAALQQQHEVKRRDLLLLKYDRQRNLMNEIIKRQKALIEGT
jgi:kinesin family protein 18/19